MNLSFTQENENYYRIDNVNANGDVVDFNIASLHRVPGNWIPSGSQTPDPMWVLYSGRIQFRYNPVASKFVNAGTAIDWTCRNAIGIRSMDSVNGALLTDGEEIETRFPEGLHHIILNTNEYSDFERMLKNEERIQDEDIDRGSQNDWSPLMKRFFDK